MKRMISCMAKKCGLRIDRLFCLALLFLYHSAGSQALFPQTLREKLEAYRKNRPEEKVYLHTDKTFYLTGENLWFKAYAVTGEKHQPTELSKVLYVELFNEQRKPVLQTTIELQHGLGEGSFLLASSLASGMYILRGYTAWMKNFDASFYFQTAIEIVNTERRPDWASLEKKKDYQVQFFPEGGTLIQGVQSTVAFQLTDHYGKGAEGQGFIIENSKDTVARFHPLKFGLGRFVFMPLKNASYEALVTFSTGETIRTPLPKIGSEGYLLHTEAAGPGKLRLICRTQGATSPTSVHLLIHAHGTLRLALSATVQNQVAEWLVDSSQLGEGVNLCTLFNNELQPVSERLCYRSPVVKMKIGADPNEKQYAKRSEVRVNVHVDSREDTAVLKHVSVSVFLLDSLENGRQTSIEQSLWLTSDLKGNVESPWYYFSSTDEEVMRSLDNVLLTHGWREVQWQAPPPIGPPEYLPEYEGPLISARITDKQTSRPVAGALCYLSAPDTRFHVANALTDSEGRLLFVPGRIYGSTELVLQADRADTNVHMELENSFSEDTSSLFTPSFSLPERFSVELAARHLNAQITRRFDPPAVFQLNPEIAQDTLAFYGKPDKRYPLDEYTRFPTMEEVMREIVAEVFVNKESNNYHYRVLNIPYRSHFDSDPLVLVDGVPVFTINKLIAFDPLKIKTIEVMAHKYFWGNTVSSGIVSYRTYEGDLAGFQLDPGVLLMEYNGLQVKRTFYAPAYNTEEERKSREPDRRNVLLWMPELSLQKETPISFFTSDVPGRYAIQIEGIDEKGDAASTFTTIEVK